MQTQFSDFNGAAALIERRYADQWHELEAVLQTMPVYLKESGQKGKQGKLVFDPIGSNLHVKRAVSRIGWVSDPPIPNEHRAMGLGVDFATAGIVGETQFAHYALFLNNLLRSELFLRARVVFAKEVPSDLLILVTKAAMMPAQNGSLYYEQAIKQAALLEKYQAFSIPVRLVGLFAPTDTPLPAFQTTYEGGRTTRKVASQVEVRCSLARRRSGARCSLTVIEE